MANGIGSVWAANFGEDGKPNGVGSVWIENASAFSGGGGGSDFDPTYMSAQIDNKLNKSEVGFGEYGDDISVSAISGKTIRANYADFARLSDYAFNDSVGHNLAQTYDTVSALSALVKSNSAQWAEGGTTYTSPSGTILINDGTLEASTSGIRTYIKTVEATNTPTVFSAIPGYPFNSCSAQEIEDGLGRLSLRYGGLGANGFTVDGVMTANTVEIPLTSGGYDLWIYQGSNVRISAVKTGVVELATKSDLPTYEYDNSNKISAINGSALAGGSAPSDTFYIYPGTTTDKEISENSGKNLKLYNSANNVFLDFAGKSTLSNYTMFSFKEITGTQYNQNTLQHLRLRVYPNATSACKVYDTNAVNLLDSNSTASYANTAQTAYFDVNGNHLAQTHDDLTALNAFVQSNSASWGQGGSSPAGSDNVLFHYYLNYDPNGGYPSTNSWVSGATELYFEASVQSQQGTPSDIVLTHNGSEVGRATWSQVSSDGSYNYFTASYNNPEGWEVQIQDNGFDYTYLDVSANGVKTNARAQDKYYCDTSTPVKFNIQGYNLTGKINGNLNGGYTEITSFTGNITDFTAKGYESYSTFFGSEDYNNSFYYDLSAEFGAGGSTVASGDVFPPTNNLDPYATYYLGWNANNGGLQWFYQGGNGN